MNLRTFFKTLTVAPTIPVVASLSAKEKSPLVPVIILKEVPKRPTLCEITVNFSGQIKQKIAKWNSRQKEIDKANEDFENES